MTRFHVLTVLVVLLVASALAADPADSLLLTFVGDIMHHDLNARMDDYDRLYDAVRRSLHEDSLSFANIEFPVDADRKPSGYPLFNGTAEYVEAAVRGGFDVFSLANNHSFDGGAQGTAATARLFSSLSAEAGTYHNGLRDEPEGSITPTVIHRDGWSIAFVSITTFSNLPGSSRFINLVDHTNASVVDAFLNQVSQWDAEFDLLIVSVHAGTEYTTRPDPRKALFFRSLVAHGADIVWGHHPHVLQPWENVDTGPARKLILHSTGNFISAQRNYQQPFLPLGRWAPTGDTALFRVTVMRSSESDSSGRFQPTVVRVSTPIFTVHIDPTHGMVPKTFGAVLTGPLPLVWRAFYAVRYAATRSLLNAPLASLTVRSVIEPRP
ncbi:MAG: CapA family protein [Spirochaetia bacterium]